MHSYLTLVYLHGIFSHRPSDRALAEPPYLIGEVLLHPLWEILRVQTLNCMGAADGGAFETEEIFGQAIKTDLECENIFSCVIIILSRTDAAAFRKQNIAFITSLFQKNFFSINFLATEY